MGSSKQWSNNNQQRNNNQRNNQGQQRRPLPKDAENLTEEEKQMIISYGFEKKGFRFDTELDRGKPSASNTPIVMLDTGNALVPGRCYDHHQLSQENKSKYPSATSIIYAKGKELYDINQGNERTKIICHDDPDNDAILSSYLTQYILRNGKFPASVKELVRVANESDTFTFKTSFCFGSCLDALQKELWPKGRNAFTAKIEAMETLMSFCQEVEYYYAKAKFEEKDPEKKDQISIDKVLSDMLQKGSEYQRRSGGNWRALNKIRDQVTQTNRGYEDLYREIKGTEMSCKNRDAQQSMLEDDPYGRRSGLSHDEFSVKLVKKQTTEEEKQQDFESSEKSTRVFFYTGTKKIPAPVLQKAFENYGVVVYNQYDLETKKVTVKISTNSKDCDLGHLGRYIETELYKERLDRDESKIKDDRQFEDKKQAFESRLRPLPESRRRTHFTGLDSICGTDPTFTGFTVDSTSNLYELDRVKQLMKEYFEDPHKVKKQDFIDAIGKDNYEDILKQKYPADYKDVEEAREVSENIDGERTVQSEEVPDIADQSGVKDSTDYTTEIETNEDLDRE